MSILALLQKHPEQHKRAIELANEVNDKQINGIDRMIAALELNALIEELIAQEPESKAVYKFVQGARVRVS